jgi:hypothetical protein
MFVFGITCVEPSGLVIREREREREREMLVFFYVVVNLWAATQNWLHSGIDNVRIFFEILFCGYNEKGKAREGRGSGSVWDGRGHKYMCRVIWKVLKCGAREGWKRSVGPIM